ncbi:hypothetical protein Ciccas_008490, partial [Cichlidogyrus casuarinus]
LRNGQLLRFPAKENVVYLAGLDKESKRMVPSFEKRYSEYHLTNVTLSAIYEAQGHGFVPPSCSVQIEAEFSIAPYVSTSPLSSLLTELNHLIDLFLVDQDPNLVQKSQAVHHESFIDGNFKLMIFQDVFLLPVTESGISENMNSLDWLWTKLQGCLSCEHIAKGLQLGLDFIKFNRRFLKLDWAEPEFTALFQTESLDSNIRLKNMPYLLFRMGLQKLYRDCLRVLEQLLPGVSLKLVLPTEVPLAMQLKKLLLVFEAASVALMLKSLLKESFSCK